MQFCPKNREDISRYFRNSYIKLHEFGDQLFFIEGVENTRIVGQHESGEKFCIYLNDETPYEMDYILPHKSFFQYQDHAVLLCRIPAKQYLRGLASSNTSLSYLDPGGKPKGHDLSFEILRAFVNKGEWPSLTAAWGIQNQYSVALSSRMMLNRQNRQLYIDFMPVATINAAQRRIDVKKALFLDEVNDLLASTEEAQKWEVKVYTPPPKKEKTKTEDLLKEMGAPTLKKMPPGIMPPQFNAGVGLGQIQWELDNEV